MPGFGWPLLVSVNVDEPPDAGFGDVDALTLFGRPPTDSATLPVNPPLRAMPIWWLVESSSVITLWEGVADRAKFGCAAETTTSLAVVEFVVPPFAPVMVIV